MSIQTDTHHFFWRGPFSNWHPAPIKDPLLNNLSFASSEHAFMYRKAQFSNDHETAANILHYGTDPAAAKRLGRLIVGFDERAWSCVREGIMTYVCLLKYQQNPDLRAVLLLTENRVLVEASPYDGVWGIKLSVEDAAAGKPWDGLNLLGECLMKVREMVRA